MFMGTNNTYRRIVINVSTLFLMGYVYYDFIRYNKKNVDKLLRLRFGGIGDNLYCLNE